MPAYRERDHDPPPRILVALGMDPQLQCLLLLVTYNVEISSLHIRVLFPSTVCIRLEPIALHRYPSWHILGRFPSKMFLIAIITLCLHLFVGTEASSFATYSDSTCSATNVLENLAANNAYPAGSCTKLESATTDSYTGFQFLTLDSGCMSKSPRTRHILLSSSAC